MNQCSLTNKVRTPVNRNMTAHSLASVIFSLYPSILTNEGHNFPGIFWPVSKRIFVQKHSYESKFPRTGSFGRKSDSFSNERFCIKICFHTGTRHKEEKEMAWYCVVLMELGALQREKLFCSVRVYHFHTCKVLARPSPYTKEVHYNRAYMISMISPRWVVYAD